MLPYRLSLSFCGLSAWIDPERCPKCNRTKNRSTAKLHSNRRPVTPLHLSLTSDGFFVASRTFRKFAIEHGFEGIEFISLLNSRHVIKVTRKIEYATPDDQLFERNNWCDECETYREVLVRAKRTLIAKSEPPIGPLEIVESRVRLGTELTPGEAGGWTSLHADMIVGCEVGRILKQRKFRRLSFKKLELDR